MEPHDSPDASRPRDGADDDRAAVPATGDDAAVPDAADAGKDQPIRLIKRWRLRSGQ